jgi:hypothetical protein
VNFDIAWLTASPLVSTLSENDVPAIIVSPDVIKSLSCHLGIYLIQFDTYDKWLFVFVTGQKK